MGQKSMQNRLKTQCFQWFAYNHWYKNPGMQVERVPKSAYEAATLDGCNPLSQFYHITLPLISPTTYFLIIINLIQSIQVYDQIQIMTQGGPGGSTTTLLYLYYEKAFQNFQMGPANAVAIVILVLILGLSVLSSRAGRRYIHYE